MNAPISAGDLAPPPSPRFEALYRDNYAFVWRCARRMCVDEGELEDVIQDVFVIAYRRLDRLAPGVAPSTWLFGIMRNVVRNRVRGRSRQQRRLGAIAREVDASERHRQRLEAAFAERTYASELLVGFLRELDDSQRAVFVLAELEGHTAKEIAAALAINPNTASSRLRLARRAFCVHFGLEPSRRGPHEVTRALRQNPEQPDASVQNRSWGLLLAAVAKPGAGLTTSGLLTVASGKLTTLLGAMTMAATLVLVVQVSPWTGSPAAGSPSTIGSTLTSTLEQDHHPLRSSMRSSSAAVAPSPGDTPTANDNDAPPVVVQATRPRFPVTSTEPDDLGEPAGSAEQLRLARAALIAGDAVRTLELLDGIDDGDASLLGQRSATRVAALCKLDDAEAARREVEQLRRRDPTAPALAQLDGACW